MKQLIRMLSLSVLSIAMMDITACKKKQLEETINNEAEKETPIDKVDLSKLPKPVQIADKIGNVFISNVAMKQAVQMDSSEKRIKAVLEAYENKLESAYHMVKEYNALEKTDEEKLSAAKHFCDLLKKAEGVDPMLSGLEEIPQEDAGAIMLSMRQRERYNQDKKEVIFEFMLKCFSLVEKNTKKKSTKNK